MQNKFGLKDFVLLVLVIGVGVLTFMNMAQVDRKWVQDQGLEHKITELQQGEIGRAHV
jgi:hypothetical protein